MSGSKSKAMLEKLIIVYTSRYSPEATEVFCPLLLCFGVTSLSLRSRLGSGESGPSGYAGKEGAPLL